MKHYINKNKEIFAYDDEQILQGYGKDLIPITEQEKDELLAPTPEQLEEQRVAEAKRLRQEALATITVEVNGKVFDGNETARNNMLASIQASQLLNIESTYWKLADNSVQEVTLEEIKEALAKAIQRVGEIVTQ